MYSSHTSVFQDFPVDANRTLAPQKTEDKHDTVLWRDAQTHVDMVSHQMAFHQFHAPLPTQLFQYRADSHSKLAEQFLFAILGNNHHMVFAFPTDVR